MRPEIGLEVTGLSAGAAQVSVAQRATPDRVADRSDPPPRSNPRRSLALDCCCVLRTKHRMNKRSSVLGNSYIRTIHHVTCVDGWDPTSGKVNRRGWIPLLAKLLEGPLSVACLPGWHSSGCPVSQFIPAGAVSSRVGVD